MSLILSRLSMDGTVVLIMVEGREWDGSDVRLLELQTKVNTVRRSCSTELAHSP
jgi:hypothetical protein